MPRRDDIETALIIGAGPIVVGQACEFDYSGTQACRALKAEGYRVVLLNSNPATIMTDPEIADATYIEPVNWRVAERIIAREKVDSVLPTMGGQTALNCALDLAREGALARCGAKLIGAGEDAIRRAEDRELFKQAMSEIGLATPFSAVAKTAAQAREIAAEAGFPAIVRPSFTLGGAGGGIAHNPAEFDEIVARALIESPTGEALVEKSLLGWKEFELEAVRDRADNCVIVCAIENLDPMGVHTGDSITVAPPQTLTDKEYQRLREAAIAILRKIGVDTGGSNVQFAVNPKDGEMMVIEMNPRVSRSSALASKATGFPIAKIAAKLAVGYTLDELRNEITGGKIPASFEPALDYVVVKAPRFAFDKFPQTPDLLSSQMQSVGESMAIGRTFAQAMQKALRSLETGVSGFDPAPGGDDEIFESLARPSSRRIFAVAEAMRRGFSIDQIFEKTSIDPWFLREIKNIVDMEPELRAETPESITPAMLRRAKRAGYSDRALARLMTCEESEMRAARWRAGLHPVFKRVDACAAEFDATTAYCYSSYEDECELAPTSARKVAVLGSGPNRIGQGIEFDYCCAHGVMALREAGFETIMINCNPETVSTDYDVADRLFFEPLTVEDVLEILRREKPEAVIVQFGGQTPLKIAREIESVCEQLFGRKIIAGGAVDVIERAESRHAFRRLIRELGLKQPPNQIAADPEDALAKAAAVGYPILARPSYVLGGRAMEVVRDEAELRDYLLRLEAASGGEATSADLLLDGFLRDAIEVDVDALSDGETVVVAGMLEHIERAGIHSGDSSCCLPPHTLPRPIRAEIADQTRKLARALGVVGLLNAQFAVREGEIFVLEVNPRASRTAPFVSKAVGASLAKAAALLLVGEMNLDDWARANPGFAPFFESASPPPFWAVKEAVLPFHKFANADALLGPEMKSTGEVMGLAGDFATAFYLAQEAAMPLAESGGALFSVCDEDKEAAVAIAASLAAEGFAISATAGTARHFAARGIKAEVARKVAQGSPHIVDQIMNGDFALIVNTEGDSAQSRRDSLSIRRSALSRRVVYFTTAAGAQAAAAGIAAMREKPRGETSLQAWHDKIRPQTK